MSKVRVRVAPSPTGDPHVGLAYVMLFNHLLAKKNAGQVVLRIEDTDQSRYRKDSESRIMASLRWLGLSWDEGPDVGGEFGPYRQSERTHIYKKYVEQLLKSKKAYRCFCSKERLQQVRDTQRQNKENPKYDGHCIGLSEKEINSNLDKNLPYVVRLQIPSSGEVSFVDELRGQITINTKQLDDQVLLKSDGFPTYHLANVVDDHLMEITHVIRAEEWISSTPKHVLLYQAFSWPMPKFAHLPLLRNKDKSKISKRKNPTSLEFYKRKGILPHALVNFLALMGWSNSDDQEIFSYDDILKDFSLKKINLGDPVFDIDKLLWLNSNYIQKMKKSEFTDYLIKDFLNPSYLEAIQPLVKERLRSFDEFFAKFSFFFTTEIEVPLELLLPKKKTADETKKMFAKVYDKVDALADWNLESIKSALDESLKELEWKPRDFFMPLRIATTGRKDSPPLVETIEVLGKDIIRHRLLSVTEKINKLGQ
jgi:glutamyl-tRNA synthetase